MALKSSSLRRHRSTSRHRSASHHRSKSRSRQETNNEPRKDRKYCLYWDPTDDPRYEKKEVSAEEYDRRRRKDFNEGKKGVLDDMYDKQPMTVHQGAGHRRKKHNDLKSLQDRRRDGGGGGDDGYGDSFGSGGGGGGGPVRKAEAFVF